MTKPAKSDLINFPGEPRPTHSSGDPEIGSWSVQKRFGKLTIVDSSTPPAVETLPAPPRPPKPPHMLPENPGHNYLNLDSATDGSKPTTPATPAPSTPATAIITDETYDFPRSHQPGSSAPETGTSGPSSRHCYSNAAPSTVDDRVFRYDFHEDEPSSPRSESSTTATYSNLPSPLVRDASSSVPTTVAPPPPVVYRELKPGRKTSDSISIISNEHSPGPVLSVTEMSSAEHSPAEPPSINRKLKPTVSKPPIDGPLQLASPPGRGRIRAAPSPTPPSHGHTTRHHSTSDEDNNALDDKEDVMINFLYIFWFHLFIFIINTKRMKFNVLVLEVFMHKLVIKLYG